MRRKVYFEDLEAGQKFRSETVALPAESIVAFARDNDPQFFHVDEEAAKDFIFGGLIASGWQTGALTLRLLLNRSGLEFAGGVVGTHVNIAWTHPVRPGDALHVEGEIVRKASPRSHRDRGFVSFRAAMFNQHGVGVQTIEATMMVFRDPARAG